MRHRILLIALASLGIGAAAPPDGKFFWRETIPPGLPYQRAILWFADGTETLLVQSKYVLSGAPTGTTVGWVVPVPDVPDVASLAASDASTAFFMLGRRTRPRVTDLSELTFTAFFVVGPFLALGLTLVAIVGPRSPWLQARLARLPRWVTQRAGALALLVFLAWCGTVVATPKFSAAAPEDVAVLAAGRVGIYEVAVVAASEAAPLIKWLTDRGFAYDDDDRATIQAYVDRGWVFTVAAIDPTPEDRPEAVASEGLVAPLILRFAADTAVYPLALTATTGQETEVLLYIVAEHRMTSDGRLPVQHAAPISDFMHWMEATQPEGFFAWERHLRYVTKFRGRLSPDAMTADMVFLPAENDLPYREHVVRW